MPETKHCSPHTRRISFTASMVVSSLVPLSKNTAIMVEWSVLNSFVISSGRISMGMDRSATESYHRTVSTWSMFSTFSFSFATSFCGISSKIRKVNAPLLKSFNSSSWPMTVSMSLGR